MPLRASPNNGVGFCLGKPMRRRRGPRLKAQLPCGYCFQEWADVYDHVRPVSARGDNRKSNLYPACNRCNGILSAKTFVSLEAKRDYIRQELKRRGLWTTVEDAPEPDLESRLHAPMSFSAEPEHYAHSQARPEIVSQAGMRRVMDARSTRRLLRVQRSRRRCRGCKIRFYPSHRRQLYCTYECGIRNRNRNRSQRTDANTQGR